ncbi:MAG: hypothetical protein HY337_08635 [Gemmatimonadetes bacterium]|jgi:hypothetical protein|nr:hypothetical protein [Gemmatimonadota bacterium]
MNDIRRDELETSSLVPEPRGAFTLEEYRRAFSLVLPDEEALHVAAAIAATDDGSRPGDRTTYGEELLDDCLILLSFLSADLRARVERFRVERRELMVRIGFEAARLDSKDRRYDRRRAELEQRLKGEGKFPAPS